MKPLGLKRTMLAKFVYADAGPRESPNSSSLGAAPVARFTSTVNVPE
jgi:hypothetical protein